MNQTEEVLIDFQEIQGEQSSINMGQTIWETMQLYGLKGRVSGCCCCILK
jgi:hypothetical protein